MALIGKIRENTALVLLFIGGGIALFVLSDIMNSGNSGPIGPAEAVMARVGEIEIERNDFERTLSTTGSGGDAFRDRDNLWQFYLSESLIQNEADALGLEVGKEEMNTLTFGPRYSTVIQQNFGDPRTGQLNTQLLSSIRTRIEENSIQEGIENRELNPNFVPIWRYQNRQVKATRLQEKLVNLVSKAMYAPSWMAQEYADDQAANRRVAVVRVPFDEVDNDEVEVSEADIQAYVDEFRSSFVNLEETRRLAYVAFDVEPSTADSAAIRQGLLEIAADWDNPSMGDSLYAVSNNGTYAGNYLAEGTVSPIIADAVFNQVEVGEVYGPYVEGTAMKIVKVVDRRELADSVRLRRIVRNANIPTQFTEANRLIDSLLNVVRQEPGKFDALADEFNRDPRSTATSGLLTEVTPGQLARPVDRLAFVTGNVGEFYKVQTPTNVQLVQIVRRSNTTTPRVNLAYAIEDIIPSKDTEDAIRVEAETFLSENIGSLEELTAAAEAAGREVVTTSPLGIGAYFIQDLGGGQDVRDMLCWAFGADRGEVSGNIYAFTDPQLYYENKYVVVGLDNVIPEGLAPVAAVRDLVEPLVRDLKKGELLSERIAGKDLAAIAQEFDVAIDTLDAVNPTLSSLPGVGAEPKVVAAATATTTNQMSRPVVGNEGVFVVKPLTDAPASNSGNLPGARQALQATNRFQVPSQLLTAMRTNTNIEDDRVAVECNR